MTPFEGRVYFQSRKEFLFTWRFPRGTPVLHQDADVDQGHALRVGIASQFLREGNAPHLIGLVTLHHVRPCYELMEFK